jgi:hypothetical protein
MLTPRVQEVGRAGHEVPGIYQLSKVKPEVLASSLLQELQAPAPEAFDRLRHAQAAGEAAAAAQVEQAAELKAAA